MSATWRRSSPYKTKPMNSVIRSDGRVVAQDETGIAGNEIHTRGAEYLVGKAMLIARKNTYAPALVEKYELTANVTTSDEWNVNVS